MQARGERSPQARRCSPPGRAYAGSLSLPPAGTPDPRDAADPTALGFTLGRIATARPSPWSVIAAIPAVLLRLLDALGESEAPAVRAALARREQAATRPTPPAWR